jgi:hypothetical protein
MQDVGRCNHHAVWANCFEEIGELMKARNPELPGKLDRRSRWICQRHKPRSVRHAPDHFNVAATNLARARYRHPDWLHGLVSRNLRRVGDCRLV